MWQGCFPWLSITGKKKKEEEGEEGEKKKKRIQHHLSLNSESIEEYKNEQIIKINFDDVLEEGARRCQCMA